MKNPSLCASSLFFAAFSTFADVRPAVVFSDRMVLQRDIAAPVFGQADPGEAVTVSFAGASVSRTADAKGRWSVKLPPQKVNASPQQMTIAGKNRIVIDDVLVGDVWLCSGQSNMEMSLGGCNAPDDIATASFPTLRRIKFPQISLRSPADTVPGHWDTCTPASAGNFTAVGFYFARRIQREVPGVPIGLLDDNWGGTRIEPWIPPVGFEQQPALAKELAEVKARQSEPGDHPANERLDPGRPCAIYNGMIHPIVPFALKGALWYQGESNGGEGESYYHKMHALVGGWRKIWGQGDFPFYFVQLANFQKATDNPEGGDGWARVRDAQTKSLDIPHTGMATIIDIGDGPDIHPKNKFDVGERLARWALKNDYGRADTVVSGPLFTSQKIEDGKIRLTFDHTGSGLIVGRKDGRKPTESVAGGKLQRFAIAGEDKKWAWADAIIDGSRVVVSSPAVPKPVAVRYAWSMNPDGANLYNREGLPAVPFRTDNW